jgi:predicted GIY-YIG superfamily endonuclease
MIQLDDFEHLLADKGILNIQEPVWNKITVHHGKGCLDAYKDPVYNQLRCPAFEDLHHKAGVYAYRVPEKSLWLYIGISMDLRERLYQHLLESGEEVPYGHRRHKERFTQYSGELELFYIELGERTLRGNYLRSIVEKILEIHYQPLLRSIKI